MELPVAEVTKNWQSKRSCATHYASLSDSELSAEDPSAELQELSTASFYGTAVYCIYDEKRIGPDRPIVFFHSLSLCAVCMIPSRGPRGESREATT